MQVEGLTSILMGFFGNEIGYNLHIYIFFYFILLGELCKTFNMKLVMKNWEIQIFVQFGSIKLYLYFLR